MRIGIIGTGNVGQHLAAGFSKLGHDVVIGTRDPAATLAKTEPDAAGNPPVSQLIEASGIRLGTMAEAAEHAEVAVLAVAGSAGVAAVQAAGPRNLAGKLVLDTTNPLHFTENGVVKDPSVPDSVIQQMQAAAPEAHFVKALNCVPGALMANPDLADGPGTVFICGDDADAKAQARDVLSTLGWEALDIGGANLGPYIEGMGLTVVNYGVKSNGWAWAVKLLRAETPTQELEATH